MNDWMDEEQDERDCITCRFEEYEYWQYPCCECGIRSHYSSIHGGKEE